MRQRVEVDRIGLGGVHDAPLLHEVHPLGQLEGERDVLLHEQHGHAALVHLA